MKWRNHRISFGREVFPKKASLRIKQTPFRRCQQCGSRNDTRRTAWSKEGDGLVKTVEAGPRDSSGVYSRPAEFTPKSGCRFCGSLNWTPAKPRKIKDQSVELHQTKRRRRWNW